MATSMLKYDKVYKRERIMNLSQNKCIKHSKIVQIMIWFLLLEMW